MLAFNLQLTDNLVPRSHPLQHNNSQAKPET